jgi:hypothetical protein
MPWLMIFQLFQSKIGKLLLKFVKNKELRKWLHEKGLFEQGFFSKALSKKGLLSGKKLTIGPRQPEETIKINLV